MARLNITAPQIDDFLDTQPPRWEPRLAAQLAEVIHSIDWSA